MEFVYSGAAWRGQVRIFGATQIFAGALAIVSTWLSGHLFPHGLGAGLAMVICGLLLFSPRIAPRFMHWPQTGLTGLAALLAANGLSVAGPAAAIAFLAPIAGPAMITPLLPIALIAFLNGLFLLPFAALGPFFGREQVKRIAWRRAAVADPRLLSRPARLFGCLHWSLIRLSGMLLLAPTAKLAHDFLIGGGAWSGFMFDGRKTAIVMTLAPVLAGAVAWPSPMTRNLTFHIPQEWKALASQTLFVSPLMAGALWWYLPAYALLLDDPIVGVVIEYRREVALTFGVSLAVTAVLAFANCPRNPVPLGAPDDPATSGPPASPGVPIVPRPAAPARRARSESDIPTGGAALTLYRAADWLVLRALGLGLLATAWMIHDLHLAGRADLILRTLTHGYDPIYAVMAYAAGGALLVLPFLLPAAITKPRRVGCALVKAGLVIGATVALLAPLDAAIVLHMSAPYHAPLKTAAPPMLKAIAGIAITAALLIAFLRQLGAADAALSKSAQPVDDGIPADLRCRAERRQGPSRTAPM
jgi:hypothetical protein